MKVSPFIEELKPYSPGKPIDETKREYGLSEVVKLASNENPLGPSKKVLKALTSAVIDIHRYPDGAAFDLKEKTSAYFEMSSDEILFGNGSNELIDLLVRVFCQPGDSIITTKAAFIAYKICAQAASVKTIEVPLTSELKFDFLGLEKELDKFIENKKEDSKEQKVIFIPNPNNPTGTYVESSKVNKFVEKFSNRDDVLIVFDEAYCEYARANDFSSALPLVKKYSNVVVLRTMSKAFGLAGLRVGILFAKENIVSYLNRVRMPFNVSSIAQVGAIAALNDSEYLLEVKKVNSEGLDYFYKELRKLDLKYYESQGNFVLFDTGFDARLISEEMLKKGVILRPLMPYGFKSELRMSVGLLAENERAITVLKEVIKSFREKKS